MNSNPKEEQEIKRIYNLKKKIRNSSTSKNLISQNLFNKIDNTNNQISVAENFKSVDNKVLSKSSNKDKSPDFPYPIFKYEVFPYPTSNSDNFTNNIFFNYPITNNTQNNTNQNISCLNNTDRTIHNSNVVNFTNDIHLFKPNQENNFYYDKVVFDTTQVKNNILDNDEDLLNMFYSTKPCSNDVQDQSKII